MVLGNPIKIITNQINQNSSPKKLNSENNIVLANPINITTNQINQTKKFRILRGSIELIYVYD